MIKWTQQSNICWYNRPKVNYALWPKVKGYESQKWHEDNKKGTQQSVGKN